MAIQFEVENNLFEIPDTYAEDTEFTIASAHHSYCLHYGDKAEPAEQIRTMLEERKGNVLISDEKVYRLHLQNLLGLENKIHFISAAEKNKNLESAIEIVRFLSENNITKTENVIVAGGGITQDLSAFACSIYRRGIKWSFFPTTLLAMCDSCIGGKSGLNHNSAKNQLGLFYAPYDITVNPHFLKTLEGKDIKSGLGEILKLCAIGGEDFLTLFEQHTSEGIPSYENLRPLILGALRIKKAIVEYDEFERAHRRILNYGHTIGHAVEALTDYSVPHGLAVTIGMITVNRLCRKYGILSADHAGRIDKLSQKLLDTVAPDRISLHNLKVILQKDKKTTGGTMNMAVIEKPGQTGILSLPLNDMTLQEITNIIKEEF